jgi:hypothetical protein
MTLGTLNRGIIMWLSSDANPHSRPGRAPYPPGEVASANYWSTHELRGNNIYTSLELDDYYHPGSSFFNYPISISGIISKTPTGLLTERESYVMTLKSYLEAYLQHRAPRFSKLSIQLFVTSLGYVGTIARGAKVGHRVLKIEDGYYEILALSEEEDLSRIVSKGLEFNDFDLKHWEFPNSMAVEEGLESSLVPLEYPLQVKGVVEKLRKGQKNSDLVMLEVNATVLIRLCTAFTVLT